MNRLMTEFEAAKYLGCSIYKLQRDRSIGSEIPYVKIGRSVRYKLDDLEHYIEQRTFKSTTEYGSGGKNVE